MINTNKDNSTVDVNFPSKLKWSKETSLKKNDSDLTRVFNGPNLERQKGVRISIIG